MGTRMGLSGMGNYMLDEDNHLFQEPAHSRRQGGVLIYVRMNIDYNQTDSKRGCAKQSPFWPGPAQGSDSGHASRLLILQRSTASLIGCT